MRRPAIDAKPGHGGRSVLIRIVGLRAFVDKGFQLPGIVHVDEALQIIPDIVVDRPIRFRLARFGLSAMGASGGEFVVVGLRPDHLAHIAAAFGV